MNKDNMRYHFRNIFLSEYYVSYGKIMLNSPDVDLKMSKEKKN